MTENVKVVVIPEAKEKAYNMGFDRFSGSELENPEGDMVEALSHYKEYAEFVNNVHPTLRAMSGYRDSGHGTYTQNGRVVLVDCPEDRPMDGEMMDSTHVERLIIDAFDLGAYDAMEGRDRYENLE